METALRELFLKPSELASLPTFVLSLLASAVLGALLGQVYVRFGHSLSNRRSFARNFLLLTVTTTLIISIVKSSLALSLGLVGALSIVRFRAAIKEPEELTFLFLAVGIGLGLGAGQALVTVAALAVILGLIFLGGRMGPRPDSPNLYLTVVSPASEQVSASRILEALTKVGARASLRRFDQTPEQIEASFHVDFHDVGRLEQFGQQLREWSPAATIRCVEDRGIGA